MTTPPAGISEADWAATPVGVRVGFLEVLAQLQRQHQENDQLRAELTVLATEVANLRGMRSGGRTPRCRTPSLKAHR